MTFSIKEALAMLAGKSPISVDRLRRAAVENPPKPIPQDLPQNIEITPEYKEIVQWIESNAPVIFVTGKAGTGKTTFVHYLRQNIKKNSVVVAPTGVAALNVSGVTVHSFFRLPSRVVTPEDIKEVRDRKLYRKMDLLIIDEVSMVRADVLDGIDLFLKMNRESNAPFGGVQVLMVGDLFQLPPVVPRPEREVLAQMGYSTPYFFGAKALSGCELISKELTKIYRQRDVEFISLLNQVRLAEGVDEILPVINQQCKSDRIERNVVITLTCTNGLADDINTRQLAVINKPMRTYVGGTSGRFALEEVKLPSPMNLSLKVGAQIMFTKNDGKKRWVNGTLGRVVKLSDDFIEVEVADGSSKDTHDVRQTTWETFKYEFDEKEGRIKPIVTGTFRQFPVMLAWAVTIHKSQGKTLEKVRVDLGTGAFDNGQVYVALSRCRSLKDIHLVRPINNSDIRCDPVIKRFYQALFSAIG